MPIFEADCTSSGWVDFSLASPNYMLIKVYTLGPLVDHRDPANADRLYTAGWVAFGHYSDNGLGVIDRYWDAPIFIDFFTMRWTPVPSHSPGTQFQIYAGCFRWALSDGTYAHILID